ncbi:hypothetical protein C5E16_06515 [Clavibacter michiganensis]|uniref:Uncharacterized protein n=2 Tax=Clavibacter michiganensis TaxID=28447 RepID=A0A2S5VUW6_9MICO|nr:hypothetical protein C5E16_06515 [Clavibacter michiganensis]
MDPDHIEGLGTISLELLWPEDHAWALGAKIDFDSTVIGGTHELINAILADHRFEAFEVAEDDDLSWNGDRINHPTPTIPERPLAQNECPKGDPLPDGSSGEQIRDEGL